MTKTEFEAWQDKLKMRGFDKMSAATGFSVDDLRAWRTGAAPIPYYVRLTFLAVFHRLDEQHP